MKLCLLSMNTAYYSMKHVLTNCTCLGIKPLQRELLPPQGFGPEAKTRGGTLGVPGCIHTRTENIC